MHTDGSMEILGQIKDCHCLFACAAYMRWSIFKTFAGDGQIRFTYRYSYSIRWAHSLAGLSSPTDHPFVKATYDGCKRLLAKPRQPKEPVQPHMLERLNERHGHTGSSPGDLRLLFIVLVGYSGFTHKRTVVHEDKSHTDYARRNVSLSSNAQKRPVSSGEYDSYC